MPPLLIGVAISAATSAYAAKKQSDAAKKAAKSQQEGTDRALQIQQQANQPYMDLGKAAAARLAAMPQQQYTQQFQPGRPGAPASNGFQAFNPGQPPPMGPPPPAGQVPSQNAPQRSPFSLGSLGGPTGQAQPRLVTLQAPDGSTRQFPMQDADRIMQQARAGGHQLRMVN